MRNITAFSFGLTVSFSVLLVETVSGGENAPHAPFAQWADVPGKGVFVAGIFYDESESYHIWAKNTYHNISVMGAGETYGIDINQGYVALQYGLTERWTADAAAGYTTAGWRYFSNSNPNNGTSSTTGLMDSSIGVRYQVLRESEAESPWTPTLTLRAGAVLPGRFDEAFPFAPGDRSAAIEPEVLVRKSFGWQGFGMYGDALFRWNRTTHNDHYIASVGLFQKIKGWELNAGFRRLGTTQGEDITLDPVTRAIYYPRELRETSNSSEAGFSYTTKRKIQYGFYTRTVFDGANTDGKFWVGGYINVPIGGK